MPTAPANPPGFAPRPPQPADGDLKPLLLQLLQGQNTATQETSKRFTEHRTHIDCSYDDLNHKIEVLKSRLKCVESSAASASTKTTGQLPGKAVQNPKEPAPLYAVGTSPTLHLLPFKKRFSNITGDCDTQVGGATFRSAAEIGSSTVALDHTTRVSGRVGTPKTAKEKRILDLHAMMTSPFP